MLRVAKNPYDNASAYLAARYRNRDIASTATPLGPIAASRFSAFKLVKRQTAIDKAERSQTGPDRSKGTARKRVDWSEENHLLVPNRGQTHPS